MKKVLFIIGSPRKGETQKAAEQFEQRLKTLGDVECSYILLRDNNLQPCKGCFACLIKGEHYCPIKNDDREKIVEQMKESDGIVFATPNYSLQVSTLLKNYLDRLAFVFHRPRFFNKSFTSIVTQGVIGGEKIGRYLDEVAGYWGFKTTLGAVLTTPPGIRLPKEQNVIDKKIESAAKRFYKSLVLDKFMTPNIGRLFIFRMVRTFHKYGDQTQADYQYFRDNGWLKSDYYYNVKLSVVKKIIGKIADMLAEKIAKNNKKEMEQYKKKISNGSVAINN